MCSLETDEFIDVMALPIDILHEKTEVEVEEVNLSTADIVKSDNVNLFILREEEKKNDVSKQYFNIKDNVNLSQECTISTSDTTNIVKNNECEEQMEKVLDLSTMIKTVNEQKLVLQDVANTCSSEDLLNWPTIDSVFKKKEE